MKKLAILGVAITTAACSSGGSDAPAIDISEDVAAFEAEAARISALDLITDEIVRTDLVEYSGQIVADLDNFAGGKVIGDVLFQVRFVDGVVGGNVDNIAVLLPDGRSIATTGPLEIDGTEMNNNIVADATGTITSANEAGVVGTTDIEMALDGNPYQDMTNGKPTFYGTVNATADGNFDLDMTGEFYAPITDASGS